MENLLTMEYVILLLRVDSACVLNDTLCLK